MNLKSRYNPEQDIAVAVDCIIFGFDSKELRLLLFKRKVEPFMGSWSLIGSLVEQEMSLDEAASHILNQLTGLSNVYLEQLHTYGQPNRDPRERVVSVAYYSLIKIESFDEETLEKYGAKWFKLEDVPKLVFDHWEMAKDALNQIREKARYRPIGFELLNEEFTIPHLQTLYESIYETSFDIRNFRKKMLSTGLLIKTDKKDKSESKKGAFLYRIDKTKLPSTESRDQKYTSIKEVIQF